ncbi:amidase [Seohaeicola zhoushanensis]|uniref:Glutamyl-tRNA amidotransferase subunit A n=1 Tax=Seohaeicola zhoushanensis TaxID=1569283 RepID=A0A8J3GZ13_9RHOB|nr:amidase [Seohaeicola zhoushanensis]GHF55024.1 glutamyl-tRNA amidotransferase subunit A [Seohaeicola zhoushanensis]
MSAPDLTRASAVAAAEAIRAGALSSEALVSACLQRIAETDGAIRAWAHLDPEAALAQAREADRLRKAGRATGALHGVPVGLKDIVDTRDMPTELGTAIFAGRQPEMDATLVERLREAGAVIMGKTKTTELAFVHPTDTTNPHDATRTPGGSSSGSAAAVAACHVPLAVGTQTNGSVIRPASFCGTYGFKPSRGIISRQGLLQTSVSLDQVGVFARHIEDAALLADVIGSYDQRDPASLPRPRPAMLAGATAEAPVEPDLAWFDLPHHDRLSPDAREGLEQVIEALGPRVERYGAAPELADLVRVQGIIHEYEICQHLAETFAAHWDRISATLQPVITRGRAISQAQYEDALAVKASAESFFAAFGRDYDAILAPSAAGEAPLLAAGGTGDPIFCTIWTLAGLPCLSLPLLVGENDLPIGVQLIGAAEQDDRLLRTASWLQRQLGQTDEKES